jgi:hypothetical protein
LSFIACVYVLQIIAVSRDETTVRVIIKRC